MPAATKNGYRKVVGRTNTVCRAHLHTRLVLEGPSSYIRRGRRKDSLDPPNKMSGTLAQPSRRGPPTSIRIGYFTNYPKSPHLAAFESWVTTANNEGTQHSVNIDHDDLQRSEQTPSMLALVHSTKLLSTHASVQSLNKDASMDQAQTRQQTGYDVPDVITV